MYGRPYQTSNTRLIRDKPDHIIFHVGTNDFPSDIDKEDIAKLIVDLAMSAKFQNF